MNFFPTPEPLTAADYVAMRSRTWEANAAAWSAYVENDPFRARVFEMVIDALADSSGSGRSPGIVLDIGCGDGAFMRQAARRLTQTHFIGLDSCSAFTNCSAVASGQIVLERGDIERSPPCVCQADAAACLFSLIEIGGLDSAVANTAAALREGGSAVFVVLDGGVELARFFRFKARDPQARLYSVGQELLLGAHFARDGERSPEPYFGFLRPIDCYLSSAEKAGLFFQGSKATGARGLAVFENVPRVVMLKFEKRSSAT